MGLFGGFKAKFTKNSSSKNKQQEVVCLRYHIHSEFDADNRETVPQINNGIKKTEVAPSHLKNKKRNAATKSAIFTENDMSLSRLSNSTPQKSLSLSNLSNHVSTSGNIEENQNKLTDPIMASTTFSAPSNGESIAVSYTEFRKISEGNGVITQKVAVTSNKDVYTDENMRNEYFTNSVVKENSTYNEERVLSKNEQYISHREMSNLKHTNENSVKENGLNDQSTLIFMTQHSSRSSSFDQSIENDEINFINSERHINNSRDENNISFPTDEAEYFKVNVIKHDLNRTSSYSEDEQSHLEEPHQFTRMIYSSQAASIFFGEGDETEVVRPRMIQLMNDDNEDQRRRSSGAEC